MYSGDDVIGGFLPLVCMCRTMILAMCSYVYTFTRIRTVVFLRYLNAVLLHHKKQVMSPSQLTNWFYLAFNYLLLILLRGFVVCLVVVFRNVV